MRHANQWRGIANAPPAPRMDADLVGLQCGAKTRKGTPCKRTDLWLSGRCKFHGGLSTGPKTAEGKAVSAENGRKPKRPRVKPIESRVIPMPKSQAREATRKHGTHAGQSLADADFNALGEALRTAVVTVATHARAPAMDVETHLVEMLTAMITQFHPPGDQSAVAQRLASSLLATIH